MYASVLPIGGMSDTGTNTPSFTGIRWLNPASLLGDLNSHVRGGSCVAD